MTDDCTVHCHHQDTIVTSEFNQNSCGIVITSRDADRGAGSSVHVPIHVLSRDGQSIPES